MSHQGITVRSLEADRVPEVVRLHCEVFARSPSGRLGPHYVEGVIRWFLGYDGAVVLAAEDAAGHLLGYAFGAPATYGSRLRSDLWGRVAGALVRRPWAVLDAEVAATMTDYVRRRFKTRTGITPVVVVAPDAPPPDAPAPDTSAPDAPPPDTSAVWSLVAIAVSPPHRKSSIGSRLLDEFERRSRDLGASELRLTVTLGNISARRFYDRAGWTPGRPRPDRTMSYSKCLAPGSTP